MKKDKKNSKFKIIKGLFSLFLLVILITAIIVASVLINIIDHRDCMNNENKQIANLITKTKDKDVVTVISKDDENSKAIYSNIPQNLVDAVISIEDKRFMKHDGIDYIRTMGAVFSFVKNDGDSNYGGSTITQQLIKVTTLDNKRSWTRKIREWTRAIYIETKLSKEQIISEYLSTIYLGNNNYGIIEVSKDFFNKDIKDLTLAECSTIAATIQSPERTNPYRSKEARESLLERKDIVLKEMYDLGKISKEEYDKAVAEKIVFNKQV